MSEQYQRPGQSKPSPDPPQKDPYGGTKPPDQKDPCDDPKPEPSPDPECKPPCPPEDKCPEKKPCPCPPKRPCPPPDPCDDATEEPPADEPEPEPTPDDDDDCATPATPAEQLTRLRSVLGSRRRAVQQLEPIKTEVADLEARIKALEKTVAGQQAADTAYKDFYRAIEILRSDIRCFIPTVRCQLELTDHQKKCICEAIASVDKQVEKAKRDSAAADRAVTRYEKAFKRATDDLVWAKKWYDFIHAGLQPQIGKVRDELKATKLLVDPSKDQCEAFFYLYELERQLMPCGDGPDPCWQSDLSIGAFLDCWHPDCYRESSYRTLAAFNVADAAEKLAKSQLDQAQKLAAELKKAADEAQSKRREWILAAIKAKGCCGPDAKCPPATKGPTGRDAR